MGKKGTGSMHRIRNSYIILKHKPVKAITRRRSSTEPLPALADNPRSRLVTSLLEVISHHSE